ncbi:MAG: hypothetical protein M1168_02425 [Candidatus Marsarchaeota archaeon]|jgi:hypothetical protein|nr:hypothetical protein [Candidatus Marsarchaeota archaeon]MCL5094814.1 hypothetical protein [Candidatus Marsarchaeota archaeon]
MMPSKLKKDKIWAMRKIITRPNYAVIELLLQKSPISTRELYAILEKKFTRKTLIISLRDLSIELNIIQPTHIRTEKGFSFGYNINPKIKEIIRSVQKDSKIIEDLNSKEK